MCLLRTATMVRTTCSLALKNRALSTSSGFRTVMDLWGQYNELMAKAVAASKADAKGDEMERRALEAWFSMEQRKRKREEEEMVRKREEKRRTSS
jgi:hypothetical protein